CPKCGALNNKKADTCAECGQHISEELYLRKEVTKLFAELYEYVKELCDITKASVKRIDKLSTRIHFPAMANTEGFKKYYGDDWEEMFGSCNLWETYRNLEKKYPEESYILDENGWHPEKNEETMKFYIDYQWKVFQSLNATQKDDEDTKKKRPLTEEEYITVLHKINNNCSVFKGLLIADREIAYEFLYQLGWIDKYCKDIGIFSEEDEKSP
ncbi:MAG TPA: zinc ribbon domain-containing protein, partial [Methanocorpusculum sp.]|nr:zinc ribbon domain-containing protein [Methanocorpusculum sp.]